MQLGTVQKGGAGPTHILHFLLSRNIIYIHARESGCSNV